MKSLKLTPYPAYKTSGIAWLGDMPAHWETSRAKWLFRKMERSVKTGDDVVTCFRDGVVTLRKNRRVRGYTESLKEIGYQGIIRGDLIIHTMDAFAGAVGVSDSDGKGTSVYSVCTPRNECVNPYYYAFCVREMARSEWILAHAKGIRERSTDFRFNVFASQIVPFPPLPEQTTIVRYLNQATERIRNYIKAKEHLINLLEEQRQVVIHRAVIRGLDPNVRLKFSGVEWLGQVPAHWEVRPLKYWVGINEAVLAETTNPDFEFHYLEIGSVGTGVLVEEPNNIRFATAPSRARRIVKNGDTIVSTVRTYLKAVWFAHEITGDLICSTGFAVLTPREGIAPKFLCYLAQSNSFTDRVTSESVGIAYPAIAEGRLNSFQLCVPPLAEQTSIVEYLGKATTDINATTSRARREIELLKEYRTRLIADVVTGKLDVREAAFKLPETHDELGLSDKPELQSG